MRLLLDTQIAIWAVAGEPRLRADARALIETRANAVWVSTVSLWEIAIKYPLAKRFGAPPFSASEALAAFREAGFDLLDVAVPHAMTFETLQLKHGDPFDRMLLAQAVCEGMRFMTADRAMSDAHPAVYAV